MEIETIEIENTSFSNENRSKSLPQLCGSELISSHAPPICSTVQIIGFSLRGLPTGSLLIFWLLLQLLVLRLDCLASRLKHYPRGQFRAQLKRAARRLSLTSGEAQLVVSRLFEQSPIADSLPPSHHSGLSVGRISGKRVCVPSSILTPNITPTVEIVAGEKQMADKPSRSLVLYGDGLAGFLDPSHTHLHSLASLAFCGFLTLPHSPPSENEEARIIREFAELLDAQGIDNPANNESRSVKDGGIGTLSKRFMGMKAAIVSGNPSLDLGKKLGLATVPLNKLFNSSHPSPDSSLISSELLKLLGFKEGKASDENEFDILFVHIGAGEEPNGLVDISQLDSLVGTLLKATELGTEIGHRLHLSVLTSYGAVNGDERSDLSISDDVKHDSNSKLSSFFPRQSYTIKEGKHRDNVRTWCPILIAQLQNGVTRKDTVKAFSFEEFKEHGGNLAIPADRFIHEVAFKLWKAPKYGA